MKPLQRPLLMPCIALILANMAWGAMAPFAKFLIGDCHIDALALSAMRIAGAAVLFWTGGLVLPLSVAPRELPRRSDLLKIFVASCLIISCNQGMYIFGLQFTSPVDATIMCSLTPVLTLIGAALFIGQPLTLRKGMGVAAGLAGAVVMVMCTDATRHASNPLAGNLLCLGAQLCAALYYIFFIDIIGRYSPFNLMKWMFTVSALTYVPLMIPRLAGVNIGAFTGAMWGALLFVIVCATFFSFLALPYAQRTLRPTLVSMFSYLQPITSALLATAMGLATFGLIRVGATILIFAGVGLVISSQNKG